MISPIRPRSGDSLAKLVPWRASSLANSCISGECPSDSVRVMLILALLIFFNAEHPLSDNLLAKEKGKITTMATARTENVSNKSWCMWE